MAAKILKLTSGGVTLALALAAEEGSESSEAVESSGSSSGGGAEVAPTLWINPNFDSTSGDAPGSNTWADGAFAIATINDGAGDGRVFAPGTGDHPPAVGGTPRSIHTAEAGEDATDVGLSSSGVTVGHAQAHAALIAFRAKAEYDRAWTWWTERGSDGRFSAGVDSTGHPYLEYADDDGSNPRRATCPDTLHGEAEITNAVLTTVTESTTNPVGSAERIKCVLTLAEHPTWPAKHRFEHGDRVELVDCGEDYDGEWTVAAVDLAAGTITIAVDYAHEGGSAPTFNLGTARRLGAVELVATTFDQPIIDPTHRRESTIPTVLSWERESDGAVTWRVDGHPIGSDTLSSASGSAPTTGVTTYLLRSPDADDAPTDCRIHAIVAWPAIPDADTLRRAEVEASVVCSAAKGYGPCGLRLSYRRLAHVTPGEREHIRCRTLFRWSDTGELISGDDSPFAARPWMDSYSAQPGLEVSQVIGTGEESAAREAEVVLVAWNAPHTAAGVEQEAELVYAGVVHRFTLLPWPESTVDYYCDPSNFELGNDGLTPEFPLAHPKDVPSPGAFTRIRCKGGEDFPTDSTWELEPATGPVLVTTYAGDTDRPVFGSSTNVRIAAFKDRTRIRGLRLESHLGETSGNAVVSFEGAGPIVASDVVSGTSGDAMGFLVFNPGHDGDVMPGPDGAVVIDGITTVQLGEVQPYYGTLSYQWYGGALTRVDLSEWDNKGGSHALRIQNVADFQLAYVDQGPSSSGGNSIRFSSRDVSINNVRTSSPWATGIAGTRDQASWPVASHGFQVERCDLSSGFQTVESWGVEVRDVRSRGGAGLEALAAHARQAAGRVRIHSCRTRDGVNTTVGSLADWQVNPTDGDWANVADADGDFGTLSAPAVVATAGHDGVVGLAATGAVVGGDGTVHCRWERRPAAGGDWSEVPGQRGLVAADVPGDGQWDYRVVAVDDESNEAEGANATVSVSGTTE